MELRHLLYFKTVAEQLHFRKAASKLFISQPPLSRQIKELEEELGVKLFDRNNKKVSLTDAGQYFMKETELLFSHLEESKRMARQIHEGVSGKLRIGYISSVYHNNLIEVLKGIPEVYPYVKTRIYEVPGSRQIKALEDGRLDIGIVRAPVGSEKLKVISLFEDPFRVVVPGSFPPFKNSEELHKYLKKQPFIFFNQDYAPDYYQKLMEICRRMGFIPEIAHEANNVHSILRLVENGLGVSIVPASLREQYASLNLSFLNPDTGNVFTEVVIAYREEKRHPAAAWFIEKYLELYGKGDQKPGK